MNKNLKCITLYDKYYIYYININKKTIKYIFMYEFYDKFLLKFEINNNIRCNNEIYYNFFLN